MFRFGNQLELNCPPIGNSLLLFSFRLHVIANCRCCAPVLSVFFCQPCLYTVESSSSNCPNQVQLKQMSTLARYRLLARSVNSPSIRDTHRPKRQSFLQWLPPAIAFCPFRAVFACHSTLDYLLFYVNYSKQNLNCCCSRQLHST